VALLVPLPVVRRVVVGRGRPVVRRVVVPARPARPVVGVLVVRGRVRGRSGRPGRGLVPLQVHWTKLAIGPRM
jgi:hypothetical protein